MIEKIKLIMADILDIDEVDIDPEFSPESTDNWDSLRNLQLITAFESEFSITLAMSDIEKMVDLSTIVTAIQSHSN